ncbi:tautomerase family protein [Marinobacterium jannaschii]|uniref:hypothetical protein n=1 Tax=Marinobacterium jannaschii TaxID=64970 RepID=UPI0004825E0C|nr:hypothetical protein [Marinobacterium jannaschii]
MSIAKIDLMVACSEAEKEAMGQAVIEAISKTITVPRQRIRIIIQEHTDTPQDSGRFTFISG